MSRAAVWWGIICYIIGLATGAWCWLRPVRQARKIVKAWGNLPTGHSCYSCLEKCGCPNAYSESSLDGRMCAVWTADEEEKP